MDAALLYLPYCPSINWFKDFLKHETIFIERQENFVKSTHRNRCNIAGANGRHTLSIPLIGGRAHHQLYKEVKIDYTTRWNHKHWQSIRTAYGSAPFFEHYAPLLQPLYEKEYEFLFEFNSELLYLLLHILKIRKGFDFTAMYEKEGGEMLDLRGKEPQHLLFPRYCQVFEERCGFLPNLSIIDPIFNLGPQTVNYLHSLTFDDL